MIVAAVGPHDSKTATAGHGHTGTSLLGPAVVVVDPEIGHIGPHGGQAEHDRPNGPHGPVHGVLHRRTVWQEECPLRQRAMILPGTG